MIVAAPVVSVYPYPSKIGIAKAIFKKSITSLFIGAEPVMPSRAHPPRTALVLSNMILSYIGWSYFAYYSKLRSFAETADLVRIFWNPVRALNLAWMLS